MKSKKPKKYWNNLEVCRKDASRFNGRKEWAKNSNRAYQIARLNGWLEICCAHMKEKIKPASYYTKQKCYELALLCRSKSEFARRFPAAYAKSLKNNWIKQFSKHMKELKKPAGYFTKKRCHLKALKCKTKIEFRKRYPKEHHAAQKYGWMEEISSHMERLGHKYKRALYAFEFEDKSVYVGLTYDYEERYNNHKKYSKWYKNKKKNKIAYEFIKFNRFYSSEIVGQKEKELEQKYKKDGWSILNIAKTGSLGNSIQKLTKEEWRSDAKKYGHRFEWQKKSPRAYKAALENNDLSESCKHMGVSIAGLKKKVICIETKEIFSSLTEAADKFGVHVSCIVRICKGENKTVKGNKFKYLKSEF